MRQADGAIHLAMSFRRREGKHQGLFRAAALAVLAALAAVLAGCGGDRVDVRWDLSSGHEASRVAWPNDESEFDTKTGSVRIRLPGGRVFNAGAEADSVRCIRLERQLIYACAVYYDRTSIARACAFALELGRRWGPGTSDTRIWCREAKAQLAAGGKKRIATPPFNGAPPSARPIGGPGGPRPEVELRTVANDVGVHDEAEVRFFLDWEPARRG